MKKVPLRFIIVSWLAFDMLQDVTGVRRLHWESGSYASRMLRYPSVGILVRLAHNCGDFYQTRSRGRHMLLVSWCLLARRIIIVINEQAPSPGSTTDTPFKVELLVRAVYVIASYTDRFIPPCVPMTPALLPITYLASLFTQLAPMTFQFGRSTSFRRSRNVSSLNLDTNMPENMRLGVRINYIVSITTTIITSHVRRSLSSVGRGGRTRLLALSRYCTAFAFRAVQDRQIRR